jgi:hypothetical protein
MFDALSRMSVGGVAAAEELRTAMPVRMAATVLRMSGTSVYAKVTKGDLRAIHIGAKIFIPLAEIERVLMLARS